MRNSRETPSTATLSTFLLAALIICAFPCAVGAVGSFSVKHGQHPRLYIDQARIDEIRAEIATPEVVATPEFPQEQGALSFDIYPEVATGKSNARNIFDRWDSTRNHMFIRYCEDDAASNPERCLQIGFQSNDMPGQYVASTSVFVDAGTWSTIRVAWNAGNNTGVIQVNEEAPVELNWSGNEQGAVGSWKPDGQAFVFSDIDSVDNVRVYDRDDFLEASLRADYLEYLNYLIEKNIASAYAESSVIAQAWSDTYRVAEELAQELNAGGRPVDVANGQPGEIMQLARLLGMSYMITGDEIFSRAAGVYIDQITGVNPRSLGGDYTQGGRIEAMGILYDWFYYELSSGQKSELASAIKQTIPLLSNYICGWYNILTTNWSCGVMPPYPDALGGHSHENNKGITAGVLAIIDEYPELMPLLEIEYANFSESYDATRAWVGVDGGHHMGWSYGAAYRSLDSIQLFQSVVTSADILNDWQGKIIDYYIYGLRGDMNFPASGDSFGISLMGKQIAPFALWASQQFDNTYAQDFYNRWIKPAQGGSRTGELLHWQPGFSADPVEQLDLSRHFRNAGTVLMRDTWDYPNATLLEFKSASFWSKNHQHLDQNSFTLFYKAPLLIDSGYYDSYETEHWHNYYTRTIAHNSITVWDPDEAFPREEGVEKVCCSNDGGQKFMENGHPSLEQIMPGGENALDGIVKYSHGESYSYASGNASKAYSPEKLDQSSGFIRDVLYLRKENLWDKPVIVVFDKVTATQSKAALNKRFLLHTVNEPTPAHGATEGPGIHEMDDPLVIIRNGEGMLYSQTVLPENALITKIGGRNSSRDYRFVVPVVDEVNDYRLEGDQSSAQFNTSPIDPDVENPEIGSWRLEIMARDPQEREYFLHVMSVADASSNSAPIIENFSNDSIAAVLVDNLQLVAFSKHDSPVGALEVPYEGQRPDILIAGLIPGTSYTVQRRLTPGTSKRDMVIMQDVSGTMTSDFSGLLDIPATANVSDVGGFAAEPLTSSTLESTDYGDGLDEGVREDPEVAVLSASNEQVMSIARLYAAAFDRQPKPDGLNFWVNNYENGQPIVQIAAHFVESPEFSARYGALDDTYFVRQLFRNVLGRGVQLQGITFWVGHLENGVSRAKVLERLSASPENIAKTESWTVEAASGKIP